MKSTANIVFISAPLLILYFVSISCSDTASLNVSDGVAPTVPAGIETATGGIAKSLFNATQIQGGDVRASITQSALAAVIAKDFLGEETSKLYPLTASDSAFSRSDLNCAVSGTYSYSGTASGSVPSFSETSPLRYDVDASSTVTFNDCIASAGFAVPINGSVEITADYNMVRTLNTDNAYSMTGSASFSLTGTITTTVDSTEHSIAFNALSATTRINAVTDETWNSENLQGVAVANSTCSGSVTDTVNSEATEIECNNFLKAALDASL